MIQHSGQKIGILESWSRDGGSKLWWVIELCSWVRLIIRGIVRNFQREGSHQFSPPEYCRLFALERLMKEGYGHPWTLPSLVTPLFTNSYSASLCPEILMCTSELSGKPDKIVGVGGGRNLRGTARKNCWSLHATKTELSPNWMGHLVHMHVDYPYNFIPVQMFLIG